jgi:hypothetical protein
MSSYASRCVCPPLCSSLVASPYIRTLCLPDSLISSSKDQPLPLYSLRTSYGSLLRAYTTYYSPQVSTSIKTNLLVLKAQLYALRQYSIDPRSTPVYHKYFMFRRFPCPLLIDLCVCCLPAPSYRLLFSVVVCNSSICTCMCMHTGASPIQRPSMCI